nr:hypothetical protein BaRGS_027701 [Batillaria attramentaria]
MKSLQLTLYLDVHVDEVDSEKLEAAILDLLLHNLTSMAIAGDDVKLELSYKKGYGDNGMTLSRVSGEGNVINTSFHLHANGDYSGISVNGSRLPDPDDTPTFINMAYEKNS